MLNKVALLAGIASAQEGVICDTTVTTPWEVQDYPNIADAESCKGSATLDFGGGGADVCCAALVDTEAGTVDCKVYYHTDSGVEDIRMFETSPTPGITANAWFFDGALDAWRGDYVEPVEEEEEEEEEEDEEALATKIAASGLATLAAVMMAF